MILPLLRRVLIISPYFPPSNAADMQRVRMSLPYFKQFGWEPSVVTVDARFSEMVKDDLLKESIPVDCKVYEISALPKKYTAKFGFGSLAFRAMWQYRQGVARILAKEKFDLVYFSTTQFPVCVLGPYWKRKFKIPYVIDMQDPWYSNFYDNKSEKPPKYGLVYRLHKIMEAKAMKQVDGLISVSKYYIDDLKNRYSTLNDTPSAVITFGAFADDLKIALKNKSKCVPLLQASFVNVVYIGRGGADMHKAIAPVFETLKKGLADQPQLFGRLKFWFIGTSYAPSGQAVPTIAPLAAQYGVEDYVIEITDRISYYHSLLTMQQADALFIPGSEDPKYTASKIYPCLLTKRPLLAIFNEKSSAVAVLNECAENAAVLTFPEGKIDLTGALYPLFENWANGNLSKVELTKGFEQYSAETLTGEQTTLFNKAIDHFQQEAIL